MASVSAWYILKGRHLDFARKSLKAGLGLGLAASLLQATTGHLSAQNVARHQPAKLAAFEGLYHTTARAPLVLAGYVDEKDEKVIGLEAPDLLSFLADDNINGVVEGLDDFSVGDRPPVIPCFIFFHGMVAIGFGLLGLSSLGLWSLRGNRLFQRRWLLWLLVFSVVGPELANQFGWFAAEVGRQPWIVYGVLRTPDALSAVVKANVVMASLILFTAVYFLLFAAFIYLLNEKIQHGPEDEDLIPSGKLALPVKP